MSKETASLFPTISYFLITVLMSIALKSGIDRLQVFIATKELMITTIIVATAFFLTLFRFFLGDLVHMRMIEKRESTTSFWVSNISVITLEMFLFTLMSRFIDEMQHYFVIFILAVLFVDIFWTWTSSAIIRHEFKRDSAQFKYLIIWLIENVLTIVIVTLVIIYFEALTETAIAVTSILLIAVAVFDFSLIFKLLSQINLQNQNNSLRFKKIDNLSENRFFISFKSFLSEECPMITSLYENTIGRFYQFFLTVKFIIGIYGI